MAATISKNVKLAAEVTARLFNSKFAEDGVVALTNPAGKLTRAGKLWALQMAGAGFTVNGHKSAMATMIELDKASNHAVTLDPRDTSKGVRAMSLATLKGIAAAEEKAREAAKNEREQARAAADLAEFEQAESLGAIAALLT
jgi:hypothetical protein